MRPLTMPAAVAAFAFAAALRLPAAGLRLRAASDIGHRTSNVGTAAIRGRVDVRAGPSADVRPDPGSLGMGAPRDTQDRRRSVVYLESAPRGAFDVPSDRHARMDQRNERFIPHVLAITSGTVVDFPNGDRTYHNVFSLSKAKSFNLGRYAAGHSQSVRFDEPGIVRVFCEIHSHMSAFILVFAHRYFAVTDEEGRYRIDGVPPGSYALIVWNEAIRGDGPRRIVAMGESDVDADFTIR
jgi:plastocyanin